MSNISYHDQMIRQTQQTSLDAFYTKDITKVRRDYKILLEAISSLGNANNTMLAHHTGLPINIVCPRVNELRKMGKVLFIGKKQCPYSPKKAMTMFWGLP